MRLITGDLGETATYSRREYRCIVSAGWADARLATLWLESWKARRRHGTKSTLSRYAVYRHEIIGWAGDGYLFDKEFPVGEHDEEDRPDIPKPPYIVRVGRDGEVWCQCMASKCKAPCCRHVDAILALIDEGAFESDAPTNRIAA